MDYLPTKFEASGAKHSWVTSCTRWSRLAWPLTLTFNLLTWVSIGIIFLSRAIYLPRLKFLGQNILELSVAQGEVDWHYLWPWPLTYWPEYQEGSSTNQGLSTYQAWNFFGKAFLSYQLHKVKGYRHTDQHVQSNMPLLFQWGHKNIHFVDEKKRNTRTTIRFYVISLFLKALV